MQPVNSFGFVWYGAMSMDKTSFEGKSEKLSYIV
jgi:hypothetical protein